MSASNSSKERQSNIELLRIVSMWMILILHCFGQGRILANLVPGTISFIMVWSLEAICYISVNLFALISGYFLIHSRFRPEKLISLWAQVFFWSAVISLLSLLLGWSHFSASFTMFTVFPIIMRPWWYATCYFGLYILSPALRKGLLALSQRQHALLILAGAFLFCLPYDSFNLLGGYSLLWLVYLFCVAAYIRRYGLFSEVSSVRLLCIFCIAIVAMVLFRIMVQTNSPDSGFAGLLYQYNSWPCLMASLAVFVVALRIPIPHSRVINMFGSATFGVFLIHFHFAIRDSLWIYLGSQAVFTDASLGLLSVHLIAFALLSTLIVYICCTLLELGRQKLFAAVGMNSIAKRITRIVTRFVDELLIRLDMAG